MKRIILILGVTLNIWNIGKVKGEVSNEVSNKLVKSKVSNIKWGVSVGAGQSNGKGILMGNIQTSKSTVLNVGVFSESKISSWFGVRINPSLGYFWGKGFKMTAESCDYF